MPASESSGGFFGLFKEKASTNNDANAWSKQTALYPAKSPTINKQKTVAFNYNQDIACKIEVSYNKLFEWMYDLLHSIKLVWRCGIASWYR